MTKPRYYLLYHFTVALPGFIKSRPNHLAATLDFLNIVNLFKSLFSPYRRLTAGRKVSLSEKLSFNLISRGIGAIVRLILILFGIVAFTVFTLLEIISIILYLLPILSFKKYLKYKNETFFEGDVKDPKKFVEKLTNTQLFKTVSLFFEADFKDLFKTAPLQNPQELNSSEILKSLSGTWEPLKHYINKRSIDSSEFNLLVENVKAILETPKSARPKPIGESLSFGYTNTLDQFGTELTSKNFPLQETKKPILDTIEKIILRQQSNNVLLVGEVGVGRHSTLEFLASEIARQKRPNLKGKRIILLDTISLIGASKNLIEIKGKFESLLYEAKRAGNIILAINQIDRISNSQDERIDLSEVISTVLNGNSLPLIGITTPDDFNQYIRPNGTLLKLFEKIDIGEPTKEETLAILIAKSLNYYKKQGVAVSFASILEIFERSNSLLQNQMQPEKSIILLEDAVSEAKNTKKKLVERSLVDTIISTKTKVPLGKIKENESKILKDLEGFLHRRIVGQNQAITEVAKTMRRARTGIEKSQRPMGSLLFLGPTGVGKTETAKALLAAYFGSESKMVRLDMTEFQNEQSVERLIGNNQTKTAGQLTSMIAQNPYGLVLLDEFEKANTAVQNLFLQILDEGKLTDAFGKKVSFANTIIIATSNAGAEFIREEVSNNQTSQQNEGLSQKIIEYVLKQGIFSPELLNRFDATVVYLPLTGQEAQKVAKLILTRLATEIKDTKNITLEITDSLAEAVAKKGFNIQFGARPIRRLVQDKIEDGIAKMIIEGKVKNGDKISASTLISFV